jgi:23S rRNA (uracil-5-)-methyltransferase RumA
LHVLWDKTAYLAYHYPQTHNKFIRIDVCSLASREINLLLGSLIKLINKYNLTTIEEVKIKQAFLSRGMLLVLFGKKPESYETLHKNLLALKDSFPLTGIIYIEKNKPEEIILDGKNYIEENIDGKRLRLGAQSFFQINPDTLKLLLSDMHTEIKSLEYETIADLYCGIGTFGILLADKAKQLISLESSPQNTVFLKENLKLNKVTNTKIFEGYSEELIPQVLKEKIDILIIDPPRKGIGQIMCKNILDNPIKYIFYISCDPATLTRDLKMLLEKYELRFVRGYDFFPQTPHIETLSVLTRR